MASAHARERIGRAVLANAAAQIPGFDLWNSRIQTVPRHSSGKGGTRDGDGAHDRCPAIWPPAPLDATWICAKRSITNKVLVIAGRHDLSTPPGMGALVASSIKGSKFVTLKASHMSNIEDATNFTKLAVDFLTAPGAAAGKPTPRPKAPAKTTVVKKAPNKRAAKKSSRSLASAKKAPVKSTPRRRRRKRPPPKGQP